MIYFCEFICFKRVASFKACLCLKTSERISAFILTKKNLITVYSKNQAVNVVLLKTKATVKLVHTRWRILGTCIFLYFQLQIRALYVDFETHVFIRFLISIKFSIIINHNFFFKLSNPSCYVFWLTEPETFVWTFG